MTQQNMDLSDLNRVANVDSLQAAFPPTIVATVPTAMAVTHTEQITPNPAGSIAAQIGNSPLFFSDPAATNQNVAGATNPTLSSSFAGVNILDADVPFVGVFTDAAIWLQVFSWDANANAWVREGKIKIVITT